MQTGSEKTKDEIMELAISDELFSPESISLEQGGMSVTVRQRPARKHFKIESSVSIPCWNEDCYFACDMDSDKHIIC